MSANEIDESPATWSQSVKLPRSAGQSATYPPARLTPREFFQGRQQQTSDDFLERQQTSSSSDELSKSLPAIRRDDGQDCVGWEVRERAVVPRVAVQPPLPPSLATRGSAGCCTAADEGEDAALLAAAERRMPRVMAELRRGIESGLCTGAQLSCSLPGEAPLHMWVGEVREGQPFRRDILCNWMSTTKPVAVVAIGQLWERNLLNLSEPMATYIPEFGRNGKEGVLVEHLLTHTAGIPYADMAMWAQLHEWRGVLDAICDASLEAGWEPGKRAGYHPYSAWFLLGEIVRRIDGREYAQYVREEIFLPLGMPDCYVGMPAADYEAYSSAGRIAELRTLAKGGHVVGKRSHGTSPNEVMACVPGANGRGPAEQWLRLFQMLTEEGLAPDGTTRLLQPSTVRGLSARYRVGMHDEVQGIRCDWSLGLSVGSALSGAHASANTFGHGGSQSSMGFCDPLHKLSVVIVCNARPGPKPHHERMHRLATVLYEDLGLAPKSQEPSPVPTRRVPSSCSPPPKSHPRPSPVVTRRDLPNSMPPSPVVTRRRRPSRSSTEHFKLNASI